MARSFSSSVSDQQKSLIRLFVAAGVLLFILSAWLWYTRVYSGANQVFWGMIDANLRSFGQTRHVNQENDSGQLDQYVQLQLGAQNVVKERATVSQAISETDHATVTVESRGTPTANYSHYTDINITHNQKPTNQDFSKLLGSWGKQESVDVNGQGNFAQATQGTLPIMYLPAKARHQAVKFAREQEVYKINYGTVKHETVQGRSVNSYEVAVNPVKYVEMLKLLDVLNGQHKLRELDSSQYANLEPVQLKVAVDVLSRNLVSVVYVSNGRQEQYSASGAYVPFQLPARTISQQELEQMLQQSISTQ